MSAEPDPYQEWRGLLGVWADRPASEFVAMLEKHADECRRIAAVAENLQALIDELHGTADGEDVIYTDSEGRRYRIVGEPGPELEFPPRAGMWPLNLPRVSAADVTPCPADCPIRDDHYHTGRWFGYGAPPSEVASE